MPNWLNVRPSWQLDDPTTEYTKAFQVANEVRLAPLKYQQAKNAIAEQNLAIANQGIQNQRQSMLLGLDAATMPEKINQVKTEGQILSMKLNSARSEQAAWERDAPKISDWMALPWEQRVKAPAPGLNPPRQSRQSQHRKKPTQPMRFRNRRMMPLWLTRSWRLKKAGSRPSSWRTLPKQDSTPVNLTSLKRHS